MPNPCKLVYFNGRGRAETIRLCFAAAGMKYDDCRLDKADWPALKPKTPWTSLPVLEVDGKQIGQSMAIARFVAREGGLYGKNAVEQALVDSVVDVVTDLREKGVSLNFAPDGPAKEAALKEFLDKTLPSTLPNLQNMAAANRNGYFVGDKITLADIHFYSIIEMLIGKMPNILASYPNLKQVYDKVGANPKIAEYLKKRPETPF